MAKNRKSSRSLKPNERVPVLSALIDLAEAATLDYVNHKYRQKRRGKNGSKIDPYAATGIAMGMGLVNDTEDLIEFGGVLGAMGAFDPDDELYIDTEAYAAPRDNRYAWRLNCEDGSEYSIYPEDYETLDEYNEAIRSEKYAWRDWYDEDAGFDVDPDDYETEDEYLEALEDAQQTAAEGDLEKSECSNYTDFDVKGLECVNSSRQEKEYLAHPVVDPFENDDFHVYVYCLICLSDTKEVRYYRTEDRSLKKGDRVIVPSPSSNEAIEGVIQSIEHHLRFSVPQPVMETFEIIERASDDVIK